MFKKFRPPEIDNNLTAWLAFLFVAFVFGLESYRFDLNYSEYFIFLYDSPEKYSALIAATAMVSALVLFYFFVFRAFSSEARFRALFFLLFAAASIVEYGYQKALGRFSEISDVESIVATTSDQKLASIFMYFNLTALLPCAVFLICLLLIRNKDSKGFPAFLRSFGVLAAFFAALSIVGGFFIEKKFPTVSLAAFCRTSADFLLRGPLANGKWTTTISGQELKRRQVEKPALTTDYKPANNLVLVIDESVRGDHFSLNGYGRKTTPFLDNLQAQGILQNWGIAAAASTGSRFSYNAMITGLSAIDFPDKTDFKINTFPTVFQYAKAMNYKTYFFDGQMKNYWGGIPDDTNYIDQWVGVANFDENGFAPKYEIDNRIATEVNKIVAGSSGNFIVIFKRGSHIPYQDSFPAEQKVFQPSYSTANKYDIPAPDLLPEVVNAYDNAIKYNVNTFFEKLVGDYAKIPNNTLILYTGDHGQTLFANGKSSHGGKTVGEATVPLFIIGKLDQKVDTGFRAAHHNIFPTLLDLMNYPENLREKRNSVSLLKAARKDSRPRFFNPDLGEKVPFD